MPIKLKKERCLSCPLVCYNNKASKANLQLSWTFTINLYCKSYNLHYRKPGLCLVLKSLPSAKYRALGKGHLCRVLHSAKLGTRQIGLCRVSGTRQSQTLPSARHSAKLGTRQRGARGQRYPMPSSLPSVFCLALGKILALPSA